MVEKLEPESKLINILNSIDGDYECIPAIRRAIKTASRKLKITNSKCIDHINFLAASLYIAGDKKSALSLWEFVEENAIENKFVHLDGAIAIARLLRINYHLENGEKEKAELLKKKHDLSHASNLDNYINPIFEVIEYEDKSFGFLEKDEETSHVYVLKGAYYSYIEMVALQGRIDEFKDRINVGDVEYLELAKRNYQNKFKLYLTEISTDSKLKKYRQSLK